MKGTGTAMAKASYEVNTIGLKVGPIHTRLLALFNEMHEAQASGDVLKIQQLEHTVPLLIEEFETTECRDSPNPGWLAGKMRGGWHVARGDFETALKFERIGYQYALEELVADGADETPKKHRMSVSASNIADELWRLGRASEGLPLAKLSVELWPSNSINYLVLSITAYYAGFREEADQVLSQLHKIAGFSDHRDALSKCMEFERELRNMRDLPSVQRLLSAMEEMK